MREEILKLRRTLYAGPGYTVALVEDLLGVEKVVVAPLLLPGRTGLLLASLTPENHPRYGLRYRVRESRPLEPEELSPGLLLPLLRRSFEAYLRLLAEAGHTAYPVYLLASEVGLPEKEVLALAKGEVVAAGGYVGLREHRQTEEAILQLASRPGRGPRLLPPPGHGLTSSQERIFQVFQRGRLAALTGGPGTGKSHTVSALLRSPSLQGYRVALAAPTGKAAKRLGDLSGREASTLHRLLRYVGDPAKPFLHHGGNPLPHDLVVVDEASMMDSFLAVHLLQALKPGALLLLVGDPHQLPPVGPGEPFPDLLPLLPRLHLTEVRRQGTESAVVRAAALLLEGREPLLAAPDFRLEMREASPEALAERAVALHRELLAEVGEAVLLTATNGGALGVHALNARLQRLLNPRGPGLPVQGGLLARVGDPLVATRNDYDLGLMNGEGVTVTHVDLGEGALGVVTREGRALLVPAESRDLLVHAYALSVHRSQGSEWPGVVVVLHHYQKPLLSRELVYTALTRAKAKAVLLTTPKALYLARERRAGRRHTWLKARGKIGTHEGA
ncbi:ATP-dependent RecD-like DNA helicase [bacterium HR39]|nr:ATP-dependent RecD-like DNA helicase [bacterium HR39]